MTAEEFLVAMGASPVERSVPILMFIPSVDRFGAPVDQPMWTDEALAVLGKLFGGATALPAGRGSWWDSDLGALLHESIVVIFCLASAEQTSDVELLKDLGDFLCRMGREANQGEVGVVIKGRYFGIYDYNKGQ